MAATARRDLDTGEEDIAAIAKQISDHAEAIYQTWKARGLAPTEILSCRPAPALKLSDGLRSKPRLEPKPDLKQRPEIKRESKNDPSAASNVAQRNQRQELRRDARHESRRDPRSQQEGDTVEVTLPPDLVPASGANSTSNVNARRADQAAMRLEVAREEERLLRALRTGAVVAERTLERPDVVPPLSLVDYAKSRYQDRLDGGARKPAAGATGERRASLGSHVTEARSKFEARARRASSAGAGPGSNGDGAAAGAPVRPFLTRGSVAERVLMFERCPSEATLELAKRKTPAATWRGPHDVINRAQEQTLKKKTRYSIDIVHCDVFELHKCTPEDYLADATRVGHARCPLLDVGCWTSWMYGYSLLSSSGAISKLTCTESRLFVRWTTSEDYSPRISGPLLRSKKNLEPKLNATDETAWLQPRADDTRTSTSVNE
ncbi:hypothetical protein EVAR_13011_1 [Eumeta japonica]|uniref:Uncharacterized protein n=1 Tax=Eumeta variegata TaxID=151549 RepID=A0A4C1TX32_EUMVA|nr:hypothetical protein EVAR_13011_1 [Eumeta japonica]